MTVTPSAASAGIAADIIALPDADLMLLVASGVIEAPIAELFRRHNPGLYNYVAWLCRGDTGEAEDIAQRTWIQLMTRCGDYLPTAAFRTFLFQIARNAWMDQVRSAHARLRESLDDHEAAMPADDLTPEAEAQLRQNMAAVHDALLQLPVTQREVVVLRYFSDMSVEDIAAMLGEKFETVKSRLRYAFTRLRVVLAEVSPGDAGRELRP